MPSILEPSQTMLSQTPQNKRFSLDGSMDRTTKPFTPITQKTLSPPGSTNSNRQPNILSSSPGSDDERLSNELAALRWRGMDAASSDDDRLSETSGDEEMEDAEDDFPRMSMESTRSGKSLDEKDSTHYSELSQRAERILENAKKKLNLLEGNLKTARDSISAASTSPTSSPDLSKNSPLLQSDKVFPKPPGSTMSDSGLIGSSPTLPNRSPSTNTPPSGVPSAAQREKRMLKGPRINFGTPRETQNTTKQQDPNRGHARGHSDAAIYRSSGYPLRQGSTLRTVHEDDPAAEQAAIAEDARPASAFAIRDHIVPERLGADRLRNQAELLQGRISLIQRTVREARTQREGRSASASPVNSDTNSILGEAKQIQRDLEDSEAVIGRLASKERTRRNRANSKAEYDEYEPRGPSNRTPGHSATGSVDSVGIAQPVDLSSATHYMQVPGQANDPRHEWERVLSRQGDYDDNGDGIENSSDDYDYDDSDFQSVLEQQMAEEEDADMSRPHEERNDAFDYEHFILHSSMGNYTYDNIRSASRLSTGSGSDGSANSQTTERAPYQDDEIEAETETENPYEMSSANESVASFATAMENDDEGSGSESDEEEFPLPPGSTRESISLPPPNAANIASTQNGEEQPNGVAAKPMRPVSMVVNNLVTGLNGMSRLRGLGEEDQGMIRATAEALRDVCLHLEEEVNDYGDADMWRQRLMAAMRALRGE